MEDFQITAAKRRDPKLAVLALCMIGLVILIPLIALALRTNNLRMLQLRDAVVAADRTGHVEAVQPAARRLHSYVLQHMNTTTGRIALQTIYDDAVKQAMDQTFITIDRSAYHKAELNCKDQLTAGGYPALASCVARQVGQSGSDRIPLKVESSLYYVDYLAPRFSFDTAGWLIVVATIITVVMALDLLWYLALLLAPVIARRKNSGKSVDTV